MECREHFLSPYQICQFPDNLIYRKKISAFLVIVAVITVLIFEGKNHSRTPLNSKLFIPVAFRFDIPLVKEESQCGWPAPLGKRRRLSRYVSARVNLQRSANDCIRVCVLNSLGH